MSKTQQIHANPGFPWLAAEEVAAAEAFLHKRKWLNADERVQSCGKAGEGNMNLTLRVQTDRRSVILKQARPWVEKYPDIDAPWDRMLYEQRFYQRVAKIPAVAKRMPRVLGVDHQAKAILLEDLAPAEDLASLYRDGQISDKELVELADYLRALHDATAGPFERRFANRDMRALNHEHIYDLPLRPDNGLKLDAFEPGLQAAADALKQDVAYVKLVHETGQRYLADGSCLVHGDYFPGSWLRTGAGLRVIDPEFCFFGEWEFDLGCAVAHFALANQPRAVTERFLHQYGDDNGGSDDKHTQASVNAKWLALYAGAEIMRRLIGVAQLPLRDEAGFRVGLLARSQRVMTEQSLEPLWD